MTLAQQLFQGLVRTVVPAIVALITAWMVQKGIDPGPYQDLITLVISSAVGGLYWLIVRILEEKLSPIFGALLGKVGKPNYETPTAPAAPTPGELVK